MCWLFESEGLLDRESMFEDEGRRGVLPILPIDSPEIEASTAAVDAEVGTIDAVVVVVASKTTSVAMLLLCFGVVASSSQKVLVTGVVGAS
jgi:hypothetical protein